MKRYKLKDLSINKLEYGSGAAACEYDGNIRYVRITDIDSNGKLGDDIVSPNSVDEKYILNDGDVLFARTGATVGKTYRYRNVDGRCLYAGFLIRVIPNQRIIRPDYLYYFTKSPQYNSFVQSSMKVVAQPNINAKQYGDLEFNVPELVLQDEIIEILSKIVRVIDVRKQELLKLDDLIKTRFIEMFGNPEQNEKGWKTCRLGDECTVINGRAYKAEELLDEGKYRVLRVGNFFTSDSWYYSDLELDKDKYCDDGDLLFAWSASFGPRIWHGEKVIFHYHIWKLIGYEDCLNRDFFLELLNYNCDVMKRGTHGSTMLHFTKTQMEDQGLILPPMEMQEQFADFVHQVDKSKVAVQKALDKAQLLYDSLMQKYFG